MTLPCTIDLDAGTLTMGAFTYDLRDWKPSGRRVTFTAEAQPDPEFEALVERLAKKVRA